MHLWRPPDPTKHGVHETRMPSPKRSRFGARAASGGQPPPVNPLSAVADAAHGIQLPACQVAVVVNLRPDGRPPPIRAIAILAGQATAHRLNNGPVSRLTKLRFADSSECKVKGISSCNSPSPNSILSEGPQQNPGICRAPKQANLRTLLRRG
jgi:hypothetical protein